MIDQFPLIAMAIMQTIVIINDIDCDYDDDVDWPGSHHLEALRISSK